MMYFLLGSVCIFLIVGGIRIGHPEYGGIAVFALLSLVATLRNKTKKKDQKEI